MTQLLDGPLLQRLQRTKLIGRSADPRHGVGERRSRAVGPGIEFADYRDYQPGDDFRYLDRHVFARHGRTVVRQFTIEQRLQVTVLLDSSESMDTGVPNKLVRGRELAAVVVAVALYGGDQVDLATCSGDGITWFPRLSNPRKLHTALAWLQERSPRGRIDLEHVARATTERISRGGLLVVVSDWMLEGVEPALARWRHLQQDVIGVQVVAPNERDPSAMDDEALLLTDRETGVGVELTLDADTVQRYRSAFRSWQAELRAALTAVEGRWVSVSSADSLHDTVMRAWRQQGVIT